MDLLKLYVYTGVPLLTCNMLFYSVSTISTSITSSQNVVRFISEQKKTDICIFKEEIDKHDLTNKLRIIQSLIYDIIKKYCNSTDEYNKTIHSINNDDSYVEVKELDNQDNFMIIELTNQSPVLNRLEDPVKLAIISTAEIVQRIQHTMNNVRDKTIAHEEAYIINKLRPLSLQPELAAIHKDCITLDQRITMLFSILNLYITPKNNHIS
jgi:hypothetical protein